MTKLRLSKVLLAIVLLFFVFPYSISATTESVPDTKQSESIEISIGNSNGDVGDLISIPVVMNESDSKPSTIVLGIEYDGSILTYVGFNPGAVVTDAGKTVQDSQEAESDSEKQDNEVEGEVDTTDEVRFVIQGGRSIMASGTLFDARFSIISGVIGEITTLSASANNSAADPDAQRILVSLSNGLAAIGDAPAPPANVRASNDLSNGILIKWNEVAGTGITYMVYRSTSNDPGTASEISEWITGTQHLDRNVSPPEFSSSIGCPGSESPTYYDYYYWIKAKNSGDYTSVYSNSAKGRRISATKTAASPFALQTPSDLLILTVAAVVLITLNRKRVAYNTL